jgi:HD superfamily phosphohydrolase YqeK
MNTSTLEEIKAYAFSKSSERRSPMHDTEHLERVRENADSIVQILKDKNKIDLNLLHAACYLHDVPVNIPNKYFLGALGKHLFEKTILRKYLPEILDRFDLSQHDREVLYEAVINHAFSIPYRNLNKDGAVYTKILQDADSLDYFSFQRQEELKKVKGKSLFYFLLSTFSGLYFALGRKCIRFFLNFPEIARKFKY